MRGKENDYMEQMKQSYTNEEFKKLMLGTWEHEELKCSTIQISTRENCPLKPTMEIEGKPVCKMCYEVYENRKKIGRQSRIE